MSVKKNKDQRSEVFHHAVSFLGHSRFNVVDLSNLIAEQ